MNITLRLLAATATALALAAATPAAAIVIVNFAFDGTNGYYGHVTGQLQFTDAGINVAATAAYVFTSTNPQVVATPGQNLLSGGSATSNAFTVAVDGVVSAANFRVTNNQAFLLLNSSGFQNDFQYGNVAAIYNGNGFSGVTYSSATAAVPEAASWAMLMVGFAVVGVAARRRQAGPQDLAA